MKYEPWDLWVIDEAKTFTGDAWQRLSERIDEDVRDLLTAPVTSTASTSTLTATEVLAGMRATQAAMAATRDRVELYSEAIGAFMGLKVFESPYAVQRVPIRLHKRGNQNPGYHWRVQKKWTKRWGTKDVPCAYLINGEALVMQPEHVAMLRKLNGENR